MTKKFPALRVLVVEDELLIRWAIAETLADAGYTGHLTSLYRVVSEPFEMPALRELLLQAHASGPG